MGIISHFVMRRMVGIHVPELAMRTGIDPMTNAPGVILRGCRDKATFAVMPVMATMFAIMMQAFMMCAMIV